MVRPRRPFRDTLPSWAFAAFTRILCGSLSCGTMPSIRTLAGSVARWLREAGHARLQEVWVVTWRECSAGVLAAFRTTGPVSFLEGYALDTGPYVSLFHVLSHRVAYRPGCSLRLQLQPYSGLPFRMRRLLTRERAYCSVSLLKHHCVIGPVAGVLASPDLVSSPSWLIGRLCVRSLPLFEQKLFFS